MPVDVKEKKGPCKGCRQRTPQYKNHAGTFPEEVPGALPTDVGVRQ